MTMMARINNKTHTGRKNAGLVSDTKGLSTVEYLILLVVIAVAGITLWKKLGTSIETQSDTARQSLDAM